MIHDFQRVLCTRTKGLLLLPFIVSLAIASASLSPLSQQSVASFPLGSGRSGPETLPLAQLGYAYPYDEQVGVTFTQNFSILAFNVTAVAYTDPQDPNGAGPGYLVNGLTNLGYWYQVGLSYNWPLTSGAVNQGFNMNYEVFDPTSASIDPAGGGGGLLPFTGTVNAGDILLLSLSFSSGSVVMQAMDWQTGAVSFHSYYANGRVFVGLRSSLSDQNGFFTGLMTEQYHSNQYYGAGLPVTYNETGTSLSSAWIWMDEWNTVYGQTVFRDNTTSAVALDSSLGQYFSSNGTAEVVTAHGLVTGLTPVILPTLDASIPTTGLPGHQISAVIIVVDQQGAIVRFTNLTITTSFGRYNFTLGTPFSFTTETAQYNVTINVPAGTSLGNHDLAINVWSWQYLETQAQEWIHLQEVKLNGTLVLTNNPTPPPHPGSNPPSSGQGPSTLTNKTTLSPISVLGVIRSIIIPIAVGYAALGLLAVVLLVGQERKRSANSRIAVLRFCQNCGMETILGALTCPSCGFSAIATAGPEN